jgi:nucleoside-diphosphate-sugar epimerase
MKIVITGATGTIGMALITLHLKLGDEVLVIANPNSKRNERLRIFSNIKLINCDISDYNSINVDISYDIFYHFAWEGGSTRENILLNLESTKNSVYAVELANRIGCKVFLGAGSQAETGKQTSPISEYTICKPESPFGASKLASYYMTKFKCEQLGIKFCWARILSVYGPYDGESTLVISTIRKLISNSELAFTTANQKWEFLYAEDAAIAIAEIGKNSSDGGIYVIGSGTIKPLKDFITIITNQFKVNPESYFGKIPNNTNTLTHLEANISRLQKEFNWKPKIDFKQGIDMTIDYCKQITNE